MKVIKYVSVLILVCSYLSAQEIDEPLAEKIKKISEDLLEGYTQPLITAFGTGVSTGLFHSAYSHDILGFDLGVRAMYIHVPTDAKYFKNSVAVCSLASDELVWYTEELDSISTIFGDTIRTDVPAPGNAVGIPPYIPGGFNLSGVPLVMPQLNVGLFMGSEIAIRFIPFTFKQSRIRFIGIGVKQQLNKLPGLNTVPLPVAIAIGGAYQTFGVWDSLGEQIVNSRTWNAQFIVSKRLAVFEPVVGAGFENTKVYFRYNFEYELPDTINNIPTDRISTIREIDVVLTSQNHYRVMAGFNIRLGFIYLHYDFNLTPYQTHNGIVGLTFR